MPVNVLRGKELVAVGENARNVSMTLEAILGDQVKEPLQFLLVVNVLGKDVLVEGVAGRTMDKEKFVLLQRTWQGGEELPASLLVVRIPVDQIGRASGRERV